MVGPCHISTFSGAPVPRPAPATAAEVAAGAVVGAAAGAGLLVAAAAGADVGAAAGALVGALSDGADEEHAASSDANTPPPVRPTAARVRNPLRVVKKCSCVMVR